MKKQIIYVLSIMIVMGLLGSCTKNSETSEFVTRGQWVTMLAETFDLNTYRETTPYYSDVDSSSELFPYVQSAKEWNILSIYQEDSFNADTPVTRREVASTAALAAGFRPETSSFNQNGQFLEEPSVNYAMQHNITENKELSDRMTLGECEAVLESARNIYLNGDGEEKSSVIYNENLVDLKKVRPNFIDVDEAEHTVTFLNDVLAGVIQDDTGTMIASIQTLDGTVDVQKGDVFITLPMRGQSAGVAYKILSMEESNRGVTFTVETPSLADLYDELVIHTTIPLDERHISWADNVTVTPVAPNMMSHNNQSNEFYIELLSNQQATKTDTLNSHFERHLEIGDGAIKILQGKDDPSDILAFSDALSALDFSSFTYEGTPSLSDFIKPTENWSISLTKTEKYAPGYKIEGNISIDLYVTPDIEYHKWNLFNHEIQVWPESASLAVQSNIVTDLKLEGSLTEEFEIGVISIPTAIEGLTINGSLSIYADLNGSVQARVEFNDKNRVDWKAPADFRYAAENHAPNYSCQALVDLSLGPCVSLAVCAYNTDIIGTDLKVSGDCSATCTREGTCTEYFEEGLTKRDYVESIRFQTDLYLPIVSLTARGPDCLADRFGLEKTWDIIGKNKAYHHSIINKPYPFWKATVTLNQNGEIVDTVESTPQTQILAEFQNGDFSYITGTYRAHTEYADSYNAICPNITINHNGSVTGGGLIYSREYQQDFNGTVPISVDTGGAFWGKNTIVCTIEDTPGNPIQEDGEVYEVVGGRNESYIVYPPGVSVFNGALTEELDKIRIRYIIIDGGIEDMVYTKID